MSVICSKDGCEEKGMFRLIDGKPFCPEHYEQILNARLEQLYVDWVSGSEPSLKFKQMLGRVSQDMRWGLNEGCLSYARIRNRAYHFEKIADGCIFKMTRHLGAQTVGYDPDKRVVETWKANLATKELERLDLRPWQEGDPDPGFAYRS